MEELRGRQSVSHVRAHGKVAGGSVVTVPCPRSGRESRGACFFFLETRGVFFFLTPRRVFFFNPRRVFFSPRVLLREVKALEGIGSVIVRLDFFWHTGVGTSGNTGRSAFLLGASGRVGRFRGGKGSVTAQSDGSPAGAKFFVECWNIRPYGE